MRKAEIDEQIDSIGIEFFKGKSEKELEEIKEALLLGFNPYNEDDCIEAINNQRCDIRDIKVFTERVYDTIIPRLVRLAEAPSHGKPILEYEPRNKGTIAYLNLAKEVILRNGTKEESPR